MKVVEKINHYSFDDVVDNFDINPITKCKTLEDWVNAPASPLTPTHASMLADLQTYDSTDIIDLHQIVFILRQLKHYILVEI